MGLTKDGVIVAEPTGAVEQLEGESHTQSADNSSTGAVDYDPQTEFTQDVPSSANPAKNVEQVDGETYRSSWAGIAEAKVVKADKQQAPRSQSRASTKKKL
jgi:hypothetical protein